MPVLTICLPDPCVQLGLHQVPQALTSLWQLAVPQLTRETEWNFSAFLQCPLLVNS